MSSIKIKEILQKLPTSDESYLSLLNLNLKFINILSINYQGYIYNRIEVILNNYLFFILKDNIEILIYPELNHKFYVLLTGDGNNTIIISEIEGNLEKLLNEKKQNSESFANKNIYKILSEIYPVIYENSI